MSRPKKIREPMPQIIARVQQLGATGDEWAANLERQLVAVLMDVFTAEEAEQFRQWLNAPITPTAMLRKLNAVILRQAETAGWRLGLTRVVQRRFSDWDHDPDGPELHKQFGEAVARSARIMQGRELPPVDDPGLWSHKAETVLELRTLQGKMREEFADDDPHVALLLYFMRSICDEAQGFGNLMRNGIHWLCFFTLEENLDALKCFASRDRERRMTAESLYDQWIAFSKGAARGRPFDQETLRQRISSLGKSFRS